MSYNIWRIVFLGNQSRYQKRANRRGVILALVSVALQAVIFYTRSIQLHEKNQEYISKIEKLEEKLQAEQEREQELDEYKEYVGTDQFKEWAAHNKLGLVYDDELILKKK